MPPVGSPAGGRGRIVAVSPERHPECLALLRESFGTVTAQFGITAENTPSNPAFWDGPDLERVASRTQLFAVEDGGRLLGCAFLAASPSRPRTWVLRHLAVLPASRHQGHGEALVAESARRAREGGARVLRIGVLAADTGLTGWYRRLGFETVETGVRYPGLVFAVDYLERAL